MKMVELLPRLWDMQKDKSITIYKTDDAQVTVTRTDKISPMDFGVGLVLRDKPEFRPTHVRLLFDLHLKRRSDPDKSKKLFYALEKVYEGEDPKKLAPELDIDFRMQLDRAEVNLYYAQLLMIEQEFNYIPSEELRNYLIKIIKKNKQGKPTRILAKINGETMEKGVAYVTPPRDFLMRFIRWVAGGELEDIDTIVTSAVRNRPPRIQYRNRLFENLLEPLPWILKFLKKRQRSSLNTLILI